MPQTLATIILCALLLGGAPAKSEEPNASPRDVEGLRTWTNLEGRQIQASLVRFFFEKDGKQRIPKITFKLKSGKEVTIPAESLSEENQEELKAWLSENPFGVGRPSGPYIWPSYYQGSNSPEVEFVGFQESRKAYAGQGKNFFWS